MAVLAGIFAGLGLFFVGVKLIGGNLKQMGGRRFRQGVARTVSSAFAASGLGVLAGALTQSTNAVTFISINIVTAGLVKARQVLPIIVWANVGTSALVLLATLNVHLLVMLLIGAVGVLYYFEFDKHAHFRHAVAALLGVGLLFLGIDLIRNEAATLREIAEIQAAMNYAHDSFVLAFIVGVVITVVAQSSSTVTVVAVAMTQAGILNLDQTIMIVYGAGVGSGIAVWLMAAQFSGTPKQLAVLQVVTKCVGAIVLVPLFAIETATGIPLAKALVDLITPELHAKVAWVYLIYQLVSAAIVSLALDPLYRLIQRLYPIPTEESLGKPRYIYAGGDDEAETGALLVEKEQQRLFTFARDSLDWIRKDAEPRRVLLPKPQLLQQAAHSVSDEISRFLAEMMESSPTRETMERLAGLHTAQGLLDELTEDVHKLVKHLSGQTLTPALEGPITSMVESLHLVVMVLIDELESPDEFQRDSLIAMTSDRSDMMDRLRRDLLRGDWSLTMAEQETLFTVTTSFEHAIWLIRRYFTVLRAADRSAVPAGEPIVT